jgi:hypothetical protein
MRVVTAHCPNIVSPSLLSLEVVEKEERDVVADIVIVVIMVPTPSDRPRLSSLVLSFCLS